MKSILMTGATGFIGCHFIKRCYKDFNIFPLVRHSSDVSTINRYIPQDNVIIFNEETITEELEDRKLDILIHLASSADFDHNFKKIEILIKSNILFPCQVVEAFILSGGKNVLNIGTYWQHMNNKKYSPNSMYAASKQAFEDLMDFYTHLRGIKCITLTLFDVYGPNDKRDKIFDLIFNASRKKKTLDITKGEQLINLTHIDDVCSGFLKAISVFDEERTGHQKYFLKNPRTIQLKEAIDLFIKVHNLDVKLNWGRRLYSSRDFFQLPDCFPVLPSWSPSISLEDGFRKKYD